MMRRKWKEAHIDVGQLRKTWGGVFDNSTIMALRGLMTRGSIKELKASIKEGKESLVLAGIGPSGTVAIKVYAIAAANFKRIQPYLHGDPRFSHVKSDRRSIVNAWAAKEYKNLQLATDAGVACPSPIAMRSNVLVMSFLGEGFVSYPRLVDTKLEDADDVFEMVVKNMELLYKKAGLVHGDLSEFNILIGDRPYLIDFSQSTVARHPQADEWLRRDVRNVCKYFSKFVESVDVAEIYERITSKSF